MRVEPQAKGKEPKRPLVVTLMGPTASGKTDLALALCRHFPCEIVSVDSAQVYRGLDIGSAKPDAELQRFAPHRLIDIRDPAETYSVAEFLEDARREIVDIVQAGRIPLLVGGTMLYFKALVEGLAALPKSDPRLRAEIEAEAVRQGWPVLHQQLAVLDPETAARIHPNHSQRIARALEVCRLSGRPMSALLNEQGGIGTHRPLAEQFQILQLALCPDDRSMLHRRIERRFHKMLELGLVEEVAALRNRGDLHLDLPALRAVGYRQVWSYLDGDYDYAQMCEKGIAATRQLAKRQLTWLRKWSGLRRLTPPMGAGGDEALNVALPAEILAVLEQVRRDVQARGRGV